MNLELSAAEAVVLHKALMERQCHALACVGVLLGCTPLKTAGNLKGVRSIFCLTECHALLAWARFHCPQLRDDFLNRLLQLD